MRKKLLIGAVITLFGFPLLGWFLLKLSDHAPLETMFRGNHTLGIQLLYGIGLGLLLGWGAQYLISMKFLEPTLKKYSGLIGQFKLRDIDIVFISFCAGFGEELLFRGSIQVFLGIWITAIVFVAIHGYLSPKNLKLSVYGIYMTLAIAALGYITEYSGVLASSIAHMIIDVILFYYLLRANKRFQKELSHEV